MPAASSSSLIPPPLNQLREQPEPDPAEHPDLLRRLGDVPDPRDPRGVSHSLVHVLALAAAAVLTGATSLVAISEWAADAPQSVIAALGGHRDVLSGRHPVPSEATIRRVLARVDGDALDQAVGSWLADRNPAPPQVKDMYGIAVDGKSLRGAARARGARSTCSPPSTTSAAWYWHRWTSARRRTKSPASSRYWTPSPTSPQPW
ncbi:MULTISPECIES: transposase family protein [unclassified Streptomyces]|uniref:transposase family protein n=1 Tax=unclassified Streptomyces TaxID=2593676 RepID=UPI0031B9C70E